jgi:hypothetical protein
MAEYNIYKGNVMKRLFLLILTVLIFSSCDQSKDTFSSDFLLGHTGWLTIPIYDNIADPYWDSDTSFWTAYEYDKQNLIRMDIQGNVLDTITIYLYPDAPKRLSDPYLSSDGSTIVFTTEPDDSSIRDVCRITIGSANHSIFTFDGVENVRLPNPADLFISSPVYPWPDKMGYLGTQLDYNTMTGMQNFYMYDFSTGITQSFMLGAYGFDNEGNITSGEYYYNPDVYADPDNPGNIDNIMFCVHKESESGSVFTVKMFNSDGTDQEIDNPNFVFDNIGGLRWLDNNTVIMTVQEDGVWKIISANNLAEIHEFYRADSDVRALNELSLSPSKTRCITSLKRGEYNHQNEFLIVDLF